MGANIEIKARLRDAEETARRAEALADGAGEVLVQEDTFFVVDRGRLKLRRFPSGDAELIQYHRTDAEGPTRSDYHIVRTEDGAGLLACLSAALDIRGVVRKTRRLLLVGQTRIHLDHVEDLGPFLELEVVLRPDQSDDEGQHIAETLMAQLGVEPTDLVDRAYVDLLERE